MSAANAAALREALKKAGFGRDAVSVRNDSYSMGSTINVRIKRAAVPLDRVEAIARGHERVDRCSSTGEILSGGNRFVDVGYGSGVLDVEAARVSEQFSGGRRRFGPFSLSDDPGFHRSLAVWKMDGATGSKVLRVDDDAAAVGHGVARLLASAGLLAALEASEVAA